MTIIATQTFDSGTEGAAASAAVSSPWSVVTQPGSGAAAPLTRAAAAAHGAMGCRIVDLTGWQQIRHNDGTARNVVCYSCYFTIRTTPGTNIYMGLAIDAASAKIADWRLNTDLTVTPRNVNSAIATSTVPLVAGTEYRSEWLISGATQTLALYGGESPTPLFPPITGATNGNDPQEGVFGSADAGTTGAFDIDTLRVSDSAPGPFGTPLAVYNKVFSKVSGTWSVHHTINRL